MAASSEFSEPSSMIHARIDTVPDFTSDDLLRLERLARIELTEEDVDDIVAYLKLL